MALNVRYLWRMPESDLPQAEASPHRSVFINEAAQILGVSRRTVYYRLCL